MKRILALLAILLSVVFLSSCSVRINAEKVADQFDKGLYWLSSYQLTLDKKLAGSREIYDNYTGKYIADYDGQSGGEVLFGGASLKEVAVAVYGKISTYSGTARIRVRMNTEIKYIETYGSGIFREILQFESGGNYIMTELENFYGHIELHSEHVRLQ